MVGTGNVRLASPGIGGRLCRTGSGGGLDKRSRSPPIPVPNELAVLILVVLVVTVVVTNGLEPLLAFVPVVPVVPVVREDGEICTVGMRLATLCNSYCYTH